MYQLIAKKTRSLLQCGILLTGVALATQAHAQNNIGTLDDRSSTGGYTVANGWGVYTVPAGSSLDSHDPRVERKLLPKIDTGLGNFVYQATYNIVGADNTTIAQILNYDPTSPDRYKPVIFIIARSNGANWDIYNQSTKLFTIAKNSGASQPTFVLRVDSNGSSSTIRINGVIKGTFTHARVGENSEMRYGNYHHGNGTATIRVKNVTFTAP